MDVQRLLLPAPAREPSQRTLMDLPSSKAAEGIEVSEKIKRRLNGGKVGDKERRKKE